MKPSIVFFSLCLVLASFVPSEITAEPVNQSSRLKRVLPLGETPQDQRTGPLLGEEGDFLFAPASSPSQWKTRASEVRKIMRVSLGLWPRPTKTPLHAVIHGKVDRNDYTVERVYFESVPNFFVTGNLYRPKGVSGKRPAVLSPHGHFPGGRFIDEGRKEVRKKIVTGAERFAEGGRSFMQSRCVQLARMGCVVFHYDMIGYGDNRQIPLDVAHRFSRSRIKFTKAPATGLYSASALLNQLNSMGLHTYNSIRALDFLTSLSDVDVDRIAVTGGSGGGTQTFMLCAVDDRPLVAVPVVIVSTTRQGGCTCENICGLRYDTFNIEFTALHAPKPLQLISADDATRTMSERGFPELLRHYRALHAEQNISHVPLIHFPHNYNYVSRANMYSWVNRHLRLGLREPIVEEAYERLTREEMSVWNESHPPKRHDPDFEQKLLAWFADDAKRQMKELTPTDPTSWERYREIVGEAWDVMLRKLPADSNVRFEPAFHYESSDYDEVLGLVKYQTFQGFAAELPTVKLVPKKRRAGTVVWIDEAGKSELFDSRGAPKRSVQSLLEHGYSVVGADLLYQGEFLADEIKPTRQRSLAGEDAFAGWTYCYNLPVFAHRVHDILALIADARSGDTNDQPVSLVGLGSAGKWAIAAAAQARGSVKSLAIDTGGFRFASLTDVYDIDFQPGAVKYNDIPGLLALAAPTPLWLAGEIKGSNSLFAAAYKSLGASEKLTVSPAESQDEKESAAARWLIMHRRNDR